jgi:hypothetical protein
LETRIKRGFPHSHSDGDGGLPWQRQGPTPRKIAASYRFLHRTQKGMELQAAARYIFLNRFNTTISKTASILLYLTRTILPAAA